MSDVTLTCGRCARTFWLAAEERRLLAVRRDIWPDICRRCRLSQSVSRSTGQCRDLRGWIIPAVMTIGLSIVGVSAAYVHAHRPVPQRAEINESGTRITTTGLNLRARPDPDAKILVELDQGTEVTLLGPGAGKFLHISYRGQAGFVHGEFLALPPPAPPSPAPTRAPPTKTLNLFPSHRRILEETGWLTFVESNIDHLEYWSHTELGTSQGPAIGIALCDDDQRIARIATHNLHENIIVWTIVHEAGHLSGVREIGTCHPEVVAVAVANKFVRDLNKWQQTATSHTDPLPAVDSEDEWRAWEHNRATEQLERGRTQ